MRPTPLILLALAACAPGTPATGPVATPAPATASYDLILEGGRVVDGTGSAWFWGDVAIAGDRIARTSLRQPWMKIGTDADGSDPDHPEGLTHPRAFGNYPRILGKYVREEHVLTLEDAIRKMTAAVATRLAIPDRGVLRPGFYADIVIFDPATVADRATFERPHQLSVGIKYVFVNGTAVVKDGAHTGAKPGRIVRGPGWSGSP